MTGSRHRSQQRRCNAERHGFSLWPGYCEVHGIGSSIRKGMKPMKKTLDRHSKTCKSLKLGGWMRLFRQCMSEESITTLAIERGDPPAAATLHIRRALAVFASSKKKKKRTTHVGCSVLPNGGWWLSDRVEIFVPLDKIVDKVALAS